MNVSWERTQPLNLVRIMRMSISTMFALSLGTVAFSGRLESSAITPSSVERMIAKYGARLTVKKLTNVQRTRNEFGDYSIVLSGVSSGDRRWLALVPKLRAGTDAATGEALVVSVAEALPKNPRAVLRLIRANPSWRHVCTYPMIEPTQGEERRYFKDTIPAVRSVRDRTLQSAKKNCLVALTKVQRASII